MTPRIDRTPIPESVMREVAEQTVALERPRPAAPEIPGFAWAFTVTFDGDTHWLECDYCSTPVTAVEAGDSLEELVTSARDHDRICTATPPTRTEEPK